MSVSEDLMRLSQLHEAGALTLEEYARAKEQLLQDTSAWAAPPIPGPPAYQASPVHGWDRAPDEFSVAPGDGEPPAPNSKKRRMSAVLASAALIALPGSWFGLQAYEENQLARAEAESAAQAEACDDALGDYIEALSRIDARLSVGLTQRELSDLAGQAAVEQSNVEDVPDGLCEDAEDSANEAMAIYAETASDWNDCIWDDYCDPDDLPLSSKWNEAGESIQEAEHQSKGGSADPSDI